MKKLAVLFFCLFAALPSFAQMQTERLKLSLWDNIAWATPANTQIINGVDLGIGSHTDEVTGAQLDLLMAQTRYELRGLSFAFLVNLAEQGTGAQLGAFNQNAHFTGAQLGLFNMTDRMTGAQIGFFNMADSIRGLQLGLVNYTHNIRGLQIGLLNVTEGGWFPAMVLVNGHF